MTISFESGIDYSFAVTGGQGAPVFSPPALPGFVDWWEPGGTEGAWADVFPGGDPSTVAMTNASTSSTADVTYRSTGLDNSQPGMSFVPNAAQTGGASFTGPSTLLGGVSAATVCFSFEVPSTGTLTGTQMTLLGRELCWKVTVEADLSVKLLVSTNGTSWAVNTASASNTVTRGLTYVATFIYNGSTAVLRLQRASLISQALTGALANNSNPFRVAGNSDAGAFPLLGIIGRIIVCSSALTGTDLTMTENYVLTGVA